MTDYIKCLCSERVTDALTYRSACKCLLIPLGTHKYLKRNLYADLTCASISSTFSSWLSPDTSFSYCSAALRTSSSSFSSSSIYTIGKIWNYYTCYRINSPTHRYRKILKISPGACIFQRSFLRGLFQEGFIIYGGKFVFRNRLGWPYSWK